MKKILILLQLLVLLIAFNLTFLVAGPAPAVASHPTVDLGTAESFAVLAGDQVVDTNISVVTGDVGLSPASGSFIEVTCAEVTGTIYDVDGAYTGGGDTSCLETNAALLTTAKSDLTTAYTDAANRVPVTTIGTELAGAVLTDGTYDSGSGDFEIASAGTLTLDGQGNPDAVFIFNMVDSLTTFATSNVELINGAQACNVFWRVGSSATLGTGTDFIGTIMADQSITDNGGSTILGRFLASIADVTLDDTTITVPTCSTPTSSSSSSTSVSSSSGGSSSPFCPPLPSSIVAPNIIQSTRIDSDSIFISWGPYSGTDLFNVQFGTTNGEWLYNTNVTGFSTTLNDLPENTSIWVRVAARNDCTIGEYGTASLVGGTSSSFQIPLLPNTGNGPYEKNNIVMHVFLGAVFGLVAFRHVRKVAKFLSK